VTNYDTAQASDSAQFATFFRAMLARGICLAPSKFEAWFLTTAHSEQDIEETISAAQSAMREVAETHFRHV
jgi:glutamate-1-semialdehyde 2,1-aminomutase